MMIALTQQIRYRIMRQYTYSVVNSSIGWAKPVVAFGSSEENAISQLLDAQAHHYILGLVDAVLKANVIRPARHPSL